MMGKVLRECLNFIKDNKALNKGGDLKKKEKNEYLKLSQFQRRY